MPFQGFGAEANIPQSTGVTLEGEPGRRHQWVTSHRPPPATQGAGPALFLRTRDRPGAPRISLTQGFQTFQPQPCIKTVHRSRAATEPGLQAPPCQFPCSSHRRPTSLLSLMACAAPHAAPGPPRLLRVALLLLVLLVATCRRAAGAPVVTELRCQCLQTLQGIHPKNIRSVNVTFPGPHCTQTEVLAALKNGQKVCLNPTAPMVQKIIQKTLNSGNANGPREKEKAYPLQFLKESILRGIKVKEEKQLAPGRTWTVFNVFNCFL
ncbi:uncharacterized protein LOC101025966 [Papio anubis]|uniref:C-X-C motif chemokine n=1 Tax=Papio anubis TaxID=9555 RepID=A0A8I5NMF4_PAPAN|nr:uncharacterized protein LOC101025966 [Papio anubis]